LTNLPASEIGGGAANLGGGGPGGGGGVGAGGGEACRGGDGTGLTDEFLLNIPIDGGSILVLRAGGGAGGGPRLDAPVFWGLREAAGAGGALGALGALGAIGGGGGGGGGALDFRSFASAWIFSSLFLWAM
jgi:hypothetical protein